MATTDRYAAILEAMDEAAEAGNEHMILLRDLFILAAETGRRLSAICS